MNSVRFINEHKEIMVEDGSNLRIKAIEANVNIYRGMTKILNCRGNGKCGTCIVEITTGEENLSPLTKFEEQKLKSKPGSYRLACQAVVNGNVAVKIKP